MRIAAVVALGSLASVSLFFTACSSDEGGGNTGGKTTAGGTGGVMVGGAGGTSGGSGGAGGNVGGTGGAVSNGSCQGQCGSTDPQGTPACYCDSQCKSKKNCCSDFVAECTVKMPTTCVAPNTLTTMCNPVTNEGCSGTGVACDLAKGDVFVCFDPPNDVPLGGKCDTANGPYCVPKHNCDDGTCRQYCCSDADCTSGGKCEAWNSQVGSLGVCRIDADAGTDAATDATTDGGSDATADATTDGGNDATADATGDATGSDASGD